jgi:phospholipid/cholesterol/gamma-HCH transport system ATP-binding protein
VIRLTDVHKSFGEQTVLNGLSLHVVPGEILVIMGRSGTGKSVTLKHVVGLERPDSGSVLVEGVDITRASREELNRIRGTMGLVFQSGALVNWLDVFDNVALPLREHLRLPEAEVRNRVLEGLDRVHLEGQTDKMPSALSGGMKKRVGIARALVTHPRILLYDEPTSGLDPVTTKHIDDLIQETREVTGATSVVVSHDLVSALRIADRIVMLHDGRVVAQGTPAEIRNSEHPEVRLFVDSALTLGKTSENSPQGDRP